MEKVLLSWLTYNRHKVGELMTFTKLIVFVFLMTHYPACGWIKIGRLSDNSWINIMEEEQSIYNIYWSAFFFVLTTITTVGYGEGMGSTQVEYIYCMFVQLLGLSLFSVIIGTIGSMFAGDSSFDTLINRRMSTVDMWMHKLEASNKQGRIPMGLFRDIKRNIQDAVVHDFNLIRDEHHFFDCLPSHLQNEIIQSLFSDFKANNMQLFFEQTEQGF